MSDTGGFGGALAAFAERMRELVAESLADLGTTGAVVEVRGTDPASRAVLAEDLEDTHGIAPFRLRPADLVAPPHERALAVLRLLDAAEVAQAPVLLDGADHLAPDRAMAAGIMERLAAFPGVVVLACDGASSSPFGDVVTRRLAPPP